MIISNIDVRNSILNDVLDALLYAPGSINFFDGTTVISQMAFDGKTVTSGNASAVFTMGGSTTLLGIVTNSGTPTEFSINGAGAIEIIRGSVGALNTGSDIMFNNVSWTNGDTISIKDLTIQMPGV